MDGWRTMNDDDAPNVNFNTVKNNTVVALDGGWAGSVNEDMDGGIYAYALAFGYRGGG